MIQFYQENISEENSLIYTITLNPSIDYSVFPSRMSLGQINRSEHELSSYGGKGINVSVMLNNLGVDNVALGFVGGYSGREIVRLLHRRGIRCDFTEVNDDSRINIKIISDAETAVNGKGPFIRLEEEEALLCKLKALDKDDIVILSGSPCESESGKLIENVIAAVSHTRFVADMEGKSLALAIEKKPFLIKPNDEELSALLGRKEMSEEELIAGAVALRGDGVGNVLVSRGKDGAILAADDGNVYKMKSPEIEVISTVGAGDSLLAGFVAGLDRGFPFALGLGIAAGSATAASEEIADGQEVLALLEKF